MAFDGSGNYVLSDTIAPATNADANELQAILTDIQNALDACVVADGQSTITGALKGADGTALLPAYAFAADLNTGIYRKGSDNVGVACGGAEVLDVTTAGASVTGVFTATSFPDGQAFISTDAGAGIGPVLDLYRNSASPAASDIIGSVDFNGKDSAANKQIYSRIFSKITDPTSTSEDADIFLQTNIAGTMTVVLQSNGSSIYVPGSVRMDSTTLAAALTGGTTGQRSGSPTAGDTRYNTTLNGLEYWNGTAWIVLGQAPTVQRLLSGTAATFTPTAGAVRFRITMTGGGGGGGAVVLNAAAVAGTASSFFAGAWTAAGGGLGAANTGAGGAGGSGGSDGTGTLVDRIIGTSGNSGGGSTTGSVNVPSGAGGGGGGRGGGGKSITTAGTGSAGNTNSGGGGSGGYNTSANSGAGGGGGETVIFYMTAAQLGASTTYTVGPGGAGGTAGTQAGGAGAAGIIVVEEFFS